jgi:hypothetical protein
MIMESRLNGFRWLALALLVAGGGCRQSVPESASGGLDSKVGRAMEGFYNAYLDAHNNQPPKDEQAFRQFLETKQDFLTKSGLTTDKMFASPRNGKPLKWVYGKPQKSSDGITLLAYEAEPADGTRLILGTRGMLDIMDEAKFHGIFPNAR